MRQGSYKTKTNPKNENNWRQRVKSRRLAISRRNTRWTRRDFLLRWRAHFRSVYPHSESLHWKVSAGPWSISWLKCPIFTKFSLHFSIGDCSHTLRNLNDWTIQLGMTRRHSHAHYGQKIKVKRVIPHPQYNELVPHDNDIALFQVNISIVHYCCSINSL